MRNRHIPAMLAVTVIAACGPDVGEIERTGPATPAAEGTRPASLFVDAFTPDAGQLVFVAQEDYRDAFPGAVFVPLSIFSVERDGIPNEFPPADSIAAMLEAAGAHADRFLIVGEPIPAGRAYAAFDYIGLGDRAALLDGGPAALPPGGAPAARAAAGTGLPFSVREDMIVDASWVHSRLNDPAVAILDARPPAEFSGETPGDGIARPGHIPGARNVFWQSLVHPVDNRLKDDGELRRMFEAAGVGPGVTVVAYCRTGGQGSFLYTVARHLGYDVRLYDGSYVDWSRTEYPVERGNR
ncbi:MAG: sulfurtransferase [Gemmatimonadetes bacterium]|nr:sulfurtransferase [Gemmatimonadota bacterium]